ncbi:alpha/beta hydrolase, partial [Candidatus Uhrbacteria bacterium]|nr:alpha/beta hydrolase [Candidatus Uhrbacteria bacterium]
MKKVFIIHGFEGSPNGGWRPWLMAELEKQEIYACALSMPMPENPVCDEWVGEISRHIERNSDDKIYLVGHSLGVPAILRYLE